MLRLLTADDIPAATSISRLKASNSGTQASSIEQIAKTLETIHELESKFKIVGYFVDDTLVSWMAFKFGELHGEKVWVILHLFTRVFSQVFSWRHPELGLLVKWAFETAEKEKYYTYLYSVSTRLERVYERKWESNPWLPPTGRYTKEYLIRIPANTKADNWMNRLADLPKPDAITILKRTLKEEFRC